MTKCAEVARSNCAVDEVHRFRGSAFLDGDYAVFADLLNGLGDDVADGGVAIGGNRGDLADFVLVLDLLRGLLTASMAAVTALSMPRLVWFSVMVTRGPS